MVKQNSLQIRCLANIFGLKSGVTTWGVVLSFCYYDYIDGLTRNTQLIYILLCSYWLLRCDVPEIFPERDNHSVSLELY